MSSSWEKRPLLIPIVAFAATALIIGLSHRSHDDNDVFSPDDFNDTDNETKDKVLELPSHVRREIYKIERREALKGWLTMKTPMYDNITMHDPQGDNLGTISFKKANWYIKKSLAAWMDDTRTSIRLNFTPSGRETHPGQQQYNISIKENRCVVCGDFNGGYARHYIVPYVYRSLFPHRYKSHMPHDIVILCPDCHVEAERHVHLRRGTLEAAARRSARLPKESSRPTFIDRDIRAVKRAASTLLHFRAKLPEKRILDLESTVRNSDWCIEYQTNNAVSKGECDCELLDERLLQQAQALDDEVPNPKFVPGPQLVVDSITDDMEGFVKSWRRHFLELMGPRYLPNSWSVDAPVVSDRRRPTNAITLNDDQPEH